MRAYRGFWTVLSPFLLIALSVATGATAQQPPPEIVGICHIVEPEMAHAKGWAIPLSVKILDAERVTPTQAFSEVTGPGNATDDGDVLDLRLPDASASVARLEVLGAETDSFVDTLDNDLSAWQNSRAEVANVSLLGGRIQADLLKANANVRTSAVMADVTGNGTVHMGVKILDTVYENVAPNTKILLPEEDFGENSWVKLYWRQDVGRFPHDDEPWYFGQQHIRMIHVHVTHVAGLLSPGADIIVGEAFAEAQTPTPYCGGIQGINASAYVARIKNGTHYWSPSIYVGQVQVAHTGGWNEQNYTDISVRTDGHVLNVGAATSRATGVVDLGVISKSTAVAKLSNVCVLQNEGDADASDCIISAGLIRAESNSRAWQDVQNSTEGDPDYDTSSWGSTSLVDLVVAGVDVCEALGLDDVPVQDNASVGCKPAKNSHLTINDNGVDLVVHLNERLRDMDPEGHTEYVVRAVRIEGTIQGEPIALTLGRAYTEADYGAHDDCVPDANNGCTM